MKKGFTLAEVLITLGIIGVVAALTLPTLIQTNKNKEVETKLKKIYSVMNQAILMSETVNGPKEYWTWESGPNFMEKYILPYLAQGYKMETFMSAGGIGGTAIENFIVYFQDGTALTGKKSAMSSSITPYHGLDFTFFPNAKNFDINTFGTKNDSGKYTEARVGSGISYFGFRFAPYSLDDPNNKYHLKKGFEPYMWALQTLDKEEITETGKYPCSKDSANRNYCTVYIKLNNWQIPKDYPFKVK